MGLLREIYRKKELYLYLLPAFLIILIFGYYPAVIAFYYAFTDWDGNIANFIGFRNFVNLFVNDRIFISSIYNMVILLIAGMITGLIPPLLGAELLFNMKNKKLSNIYRFLFIIPMLIPSVVVMLVWQNLVFEPNVGLLNSILSALGFEKIGWLGDYHTALYSLILIGFPWVSGVNFLIYMAGLQNVPESVYDSAKLDGATGIKRFIYIDLPLLLGQIKLLVILGIIGGIQGFGLQYILTNGGPANSTMVPGYWMYRNAFGYGNFGYASAIGLLMFGVILILTIINSRIGKANEVSY